MLLNLQAENYTFTFLILPDNDMRSEDLDEGAFDEPYLSERRRGYQAGEWSYVGVMALAEFETEEGYAVSIEGPSLWGLESDDEEYIRATAQELIAEMKGGLNVSD